jgi:hypothetical protein
MKYLRTVLGERASYEGKLKMEHNVVKFRFDYRYFLLSMHVIGHPVD